MILLENENINGVIAVAVKGRLDSVTASKMETHCKALIDEGQTRILIDLKELEYISSAGLRVLLVIAKSLKSKSGTLVLCQLSSMVMEVMVISGFDKIFAMTATREEGLARF